MADTDDGAGSAWSCCWPAPGKVNLFLHLTGERSDGYYALQSLVQFLDWGDALALRARHDGVIRRLAGPVEIAPEEDLTVLAAHELRAATGVEKGADLFVDKSLPNGSGLGGGSSDAATALVALNHIWRTGLGTDELARIGLGLGTDVPVFVHGHAAWVEGLGESLSFVEPREPWYLIVDVGERVATHELFAAPELTRECPAMTMHDFASGAGSNVFEAPVRARCPAIGQAMDWFNEAGVAPRLAGTGACVFAALASENDARALRARLPEAWRGYVARGENRSRLATHVAALTEAKNNWAVAKR